MQTLSKLDRELSMLEPESYPTLGSPAESLLIIQEQHSITLDQNLALRFMFNGLVFDLHARLTYPWCSGASAAQHVPNHAIQVLRSQSMVLDTCRNTVQL